MPWSSTAQRRVFKVAAAATLPALLALLLAGRPAQAGGQAGVPDGSPTAATPSSLKLFTDSTLVPGERFSVEVVGRGPDVVLIPGLASARETWRHTAERLRGRYRLHLVQMAGFAGEPARANATGPFFDPVAEELDRYLVRLRKPIVVGHSLGGTLALALAERHPEHMAKVFIVDSLPFYGVLMGGPSATSASLKPIVEGMRSRPAVAMPPAQQQAMMAAMVTAPQDIERVARWGSASDPAVVMTAMTDDMLADLRPDLAKATVPVTVIYETPLEPMIQTGYAALPDKVLIAAKPGVKHFIMYDDPAGFDAALDAFLAK